jgi:hypothetical protein
VSQETTNRSFDELARSLAEGSISRRRALKLFAGTAIAALIPSTRAMAAITCPRGTVKICHVPRRADGTCRRGAAETRCVTPEAAATHAGHPCDCCGGCGGTDDCREPRPRTCFSTPPMCIPDGEACSADSDCCSSICFGDVCIPANAICCRCQGGCVPTTCVSEPDCSDATALNQLCTEICGSFAGCGDFVMGSYTCTPNTCLCGSTP